MLYGLKAEIIESIHQVFRSYPQIREVILFGSRSKGNFREGSDIDLAIKGTDIDLALLSRLDTKLDDLMLPYTFDLLSYPSLKNKALISQIDSTGVIFYKV